jgi:hypothetical protein
MLQSISSSSPSAAGAGLQLQFLAMGRFLLLAALLLPHIGQVQAGVLLMTPVADLSKASPAAADVSPGPLLPSKVGLIYLDTNALMAIAPAPINVVDFIPLPDVSLQAVRTDQVSSSQWTGTLVGYTAGDVTFVRTADGTLAGAISTGNGTFYHLTIDPSGSGRVEEFEYANMPQEDDGVVPPSAAAQVKGSSTTDDVALGPASIMDSLESLDRSRRQDDGSVIKVMVFYTAAACCRIAFGTATCDPQACRAATVASMVLAETETNQGYAASGLQIVIDVSYIREVIYSEAGKSYADHLNTMASSAAINNVRNANAADLVVTIVDDPRFCGMAWQPAEPNRDTGFSVVTYSCVNAGMYSFGELIPAYS